MKKKLFILMLLVGVDSLSFGFILPILPFLVSKFWGNSLTAGIIISASAIGMFLGGNLFGRLSDRFGRRRILLITSSINAFSYLLLGLSHAIVWFLVARFLSGLAGGGTAVSQALISDISSPETRTRNMGYVGASITLGLTMWPILSMSILSGLSMEWLAYLSCAAMLVNVFLVAKFIPNTIHHENASLVPDRFLPQKDDISNLQGRIFLLILTFCLISIVFTGTNTVFGLFMKGAFNYTEKNVITFFGIFGICAIAYQIAILPWVRNKIKETGMIILGLALVSLGFFILSYIAFTQSYPDMALVGGICMILGMSNTNTAIYSLLSSQCHTKECGKVLGINTAFASIGDIIGPIFAGWISLISPVLPFLIFGLGAACNLGAFIILQKRLGLKDTQ